MQSNTTLLELVNNILVNVGERPVNSISSFPSQKAADAIANALQDISTATDWHFARESTPAVSWLNDQATLPEMHRLLGVTREGQSLTAQNREAYPWYNATEGTPQFFCQKDTNTVLVQPYPTDTALQQSIIFHYISALTMPMYAPDTFPLPERFIPTLKKGATSYLLLAHLDDASAAQQWKRLFDEDIFKLVRRETGVTVGSRSMFRRR